MTIIIFSCSPQWKSDLKFTILEFNGPLIFDLTAVGDFWDHIWNQYVLLVTIEGHFSLSSTNPTTHPPGQQVYSYLKTYSKHSNL